VSDRLPRFPIPRDPGGASTGELSALALRAGREVEDAPAIPALHVDPEDIDARAEALWYYWHAKQLAMTAADPRVALAAMRELRAILALILVARPPELNFDSWDELTGTERLTKVAELRKQLDAIEAKELAQSGRGK
jgi:hypothetical protein